MSSISCRLSAAYCSSNKYVRMASHDCLAFF